MECRKEKAREWTIRLQQDIYECNVHFMTMTFSNESLESLSKENPEPNSIAARAVRLFCKRWKKKYKEPIKHWLITELGHENTERLHLHGFLWTSKKCGEIEKVWGYGWVDTGEWVNEESVSYVVKYITKNDEDHPEFKPKIFTTPGIGRKWLKSKQAEDCKKNPVGERRFIRNSAGFKMALPNYYARNLYSDKEREAMAIEYADKKIKYVCGEKVDVSTIDGKRRYIKLQNYYRKKSKLFGYKK